MENRNFPAARVYGSAGPVSLKTRRVASEVATGNDGLKGTTFFLAEVARSFSILHSLSAEKFRALLIQPAVLQQEHVYVSCRSKCTR
jgi:hypothetical protein